MSNKTDTIMNINKKLYVTILAAGIGKRMASNTPKVLHEIYYKNGKKLPMLVSICKEILKLYPEKIIIVVNPDNYSQIKNTLDEFLVNHHINFCIQKNALGTGHAVIQTIDELIDDDATNIILNGDVPFITCDTLQNILSDSQSIFNIVATVLQNPTGNGRIILSDNTQTHSQTQFMEIIEERDCNECQKNIKLINCGIYLCIVKYLKQILPLLNNDNNQKEYYITDIFNIGRKKGYPIHIHYLPDEKRYQIMNINTPQNLLDANLYAQHHMIFQ